MNRKGGSSGRADKKQWDVRHVHIHFTGAPYTITKRITAIVRYI